MPLLPDPWTAAVAAWPAIWLADLVRYLIVAGAFAVALAWLPVAWRARRSVRIRQPAERQRLREFGLSMVTVLVFSLVGTGVLMGYHAGLMKIYFEPAAHGWPWLVASFFVMVVLHDAWFYWTHRLMHHRRLFGWTHRAHHRSLAPTPWAAY